MNIGARCSQVLTGQFAHIQPVQLGLGPDQAVPRRHGFQTGRHLSRENEAGPHGVCWSHHHQYDHLSAHHTHTMPVRSSPRTRNALANKPSPLSDYWTISLAPQNCIDIGLNLFVSSCINTTVDFLVVLLPLTVLGGLKLPRRQFCVVVGLFGVAFGATIAAAIRTYYTWYMTIDFDHTWHGWTVALTSSIELHLGIVCTESNQVNPANGVRSVRRYQLYDRYYQYTLHAMQFYDLN